MPTLFEEQVDHLSHSHFLLLYWVAQSEGRGRRYNITNCFDDLKHAGITRTKQNAVATVEALAALRFLELREEGNRKHLFITKHGAQALQSLILDQKYPTHPSAFLEGN